MCIRFFWQTLYISDVSAGFCLCQHEVVAKTNCWHIKMICCWNFHKHNIIQIGLLTHCLWFRNSAVEDAGDSAHGCEASLHRLEHEEHYSCHFVTKCQNVLPVRRHPPALRTVSWMNGSSLHTLDCLQRRDLRMFPFQQLMSVDVQVSQELTVWCIFIYLFIYLFIMHSVYPYKVD